jgi:hypothetical protein
MTAQWKRVMPGWYVSRTAPTVEVKTYCDCNLSNCMMKWAVYLNDEVWNSSYSWSRAEATRDAEQLIAAGVPA